MSRRPGPREGEDPERKARPNPYSDRRLSLEGPGPGHLTQGAVPRRHSSARPDCSACTCQLPRCRRRGPARRPAGGRPLARATGIPDGSMATEGTYVTLSTRRMEPNSPRRAGRSSRAVRCGPRDGRADQVSRPACRSEPHRMPQYGAGSADAVGPAAAPEYATVRTGGEQGGAIPGWCGGSWCPPLRTSLRRAVARRVDSWPGWVRLAPAPGQCTSGSRQRAVLSPALLARSTASWTTRSASARPAHTAECTDLPGSRSL